MKLFSNLSSAASLAVVMLLTTSPMFGQDEAPPKEPATTSKSNESKSGNLVRLDKEHEIWLEKKKKWGGGGWSRLPT